MRKLYFNLMPISKIHYLAQKLWTNTYKFDNDGKKNYHKYTVGLKKVIEIYLRKFQRVPNLISLYFDQINKRQKVMKAPRKRSSADTTQYVIPAPWLFRTLPYLCVDMCEQSLPRRRVGRRGLVCGWQGAHT